MGLAQRNYARELAALWVCRRSRPITIFENNSVLSDLPSYVPSLPSVIYTGEMHQQLEDELIVLASKGDRLPY